MPLLERVASSKLNLIQKIEPLTFNTDDKYTENIIKNYLSLIKGLGELEDVYEIKLKHKHIPFALTVGRKVPLPLLEETKVELDGMLEMGVCTMVVVLKPSGDVRICVDSTK